MPNSKNAAKRAKTSEKSRQRNAETKSALKTLRKGLLAAVAENAAPKTQDAYRAFCAALDKAVKHGIIAKNTSIRKKARAAALLRKSAAK
ncbi:MAG TPA: 30S ribosomal protein S20 [Verrucomicrobia bacterium]|nr:30S ribosomal protein S20 [Verrucomicrobiota bacterium]